MALIVRTRGREQRRGAVECDELGSSPIAPGWITVGKCLDTWAPRSLYLWETPLAQVWMPEVLPTRARGRAEVFFLSGSAACSGGPGQRSNKEKKR